VYAGLAGCAATVASQVAKPIQTSAPGSYRSVAVAVITQRSGDEEKETVETLRSGIVKRLADSGAFQIVHGIADLSQSTADLNALVSVEQFAYVSGTLRYSLGGLGGKARLGVRVQLAEAKTQQKIGDATFDTASSGWQAFFGATTPRQVQAMIDKVAETILQANR
jgi:hypothetical protein